MSEEYDQLQSDQTARYISPEREEALARVSALTDALRKEGRSGENIVSLFGPFYTATICVSDDVDYALLAEYGMLDTLEYYFDTNVGNDDISDSVAGGENTYNSYITVTDGPEGA